VDTVFYDDPQNGEMAGFGEELMSHSIPTQDKHIYYYFFIEYFSHRVLDIINSSLLSH
jgi:hypothetical protein